jgi:hypothetical protein
MLDFGASSNVMTRNVMEQLNLRISRPYHNVCAMDSRQIEVHGLIKDLQLHLAVYLDISVLMDVVVIDVQMHGVWSYLGCGVQVWEVVFKWIYHMLPSQFVLTLLSDLIESRKEGTM